MREQVIELLPEVKEIKNRELREKVIDCWVEAITFRNWSVEELQNLPFTLIVDKVKIYFIEHVRTCTKMAIAVDRILENTYANRKTPVNRDFLIAGCLLADIGKLYEYDKKGDGTIIKSEYGKHIRHPFSGVGLAFKHNLPSEVMHIIAVHSKEGTSEERSPEAIIFHHVDFISFDLVKFKP
jgi:23S rRNA maturation-related 3'-5' exoribonuclease YhaM